MSHQAHLTPHETCEIMITLLGVSKSVSLSHVQQQVCRRRWSVYKYNNNSSSSSELLLREWHTNLLGHISDFCFLHYSTQVSLSLWISPPHPPPPLSLPDCITVLICKDAYRVQSDPYTPLEFIHSISYKPRTLPAPFFPSRIMAATLCTVIKTATHTTHVSVWFVPFDPTHGHQRCSVRRL